MKIYHIGIVSILAAMTLSLSGRAEEIADYIDQARSAYMSYDFEEAARHLASAKRKLRKADKESAAEIKAIEEKIATLRNYMERVENIEILDSISVSKDDFFKHYKLPHSSGSLGDATALPAPDQETDYVFTNEGDDFKIWAAPDTTGYLTLRTATRLTDGSWSAPETLDDLSVEDANVAYPFMMSDGVTLYYASDGPESIGGYDIMVASRDAVEGSFLQPQNLGMPYNSPYDDYLLAIDELNGVGWWATDRNRLDDLITIYLYKVNDMRRNYDAEEENIEDRAMLVDWQTTQNPETDYSELLETINSIVPGEARKHEDFRLPMDGGVVYTTYDDFKSDTAASLMKKYIASLQRYKEQEDEIMQLRQQYHQSRNQSTGASLHRLEQQSETMREELKRQLSDIYRAERKQK